MSGNDFDYDLIVIGFGGSVAAFDDLCTFDGVPLSAGLLTGTTLMCQCDGSQFDLTSGVALRGPATVPLTIYDVGEGNGEIQVRIGAQTNGWQKSGTSVISMKEEWKRIFTFETN